MNNQKYYYSDANKSDVNFDFVSFRVSHIFHHRLEFNQMNVFFAVEFFFFEREV